MGDEPPVGLFNIPPSPRFGERGPGGEGMSHERSKPVGPLTPRPPLPEAGRGGAVLTWLTVLSFLTGCVTPLAKIHTARDAFAAGDFAAARTTLVDVADAGGRFAAAADLDLAVLELAAGDTASAETRLRRLRDALDDADDGVLDKTAGAIASTASMLSDDTVRGFRAAPHEQVMIRTLLSINSLVAGTGDAEAYAAQAAMKQSAYRRQIDEKPELLDLLPDANPYQPLAFAPYIRGVLRESNHHDYDDAARSYRLVSAITPSFAPAAADLDRATGGKHSRPGHGVVYVIAMIGRGPRLVAATAEKTEAAMRVAGIILSATDNDEATAALPNLVPAQIPVIDLPHVPIATLGVDFENQSLGMTQRLVDVADMARRQTDAAQPMVVGRMLARRAVKYAAVRTASDAVGLDGTAAMLSRWAALNAWTAAESVDTRCWGLLPREIQTMRIELPVGRRVLDLHPVDQAGIVCGPVDRVDVDVVDGRNTYLVVFAPIDRVVAVTR